MAVRVVGLGEYLSMAMRTIAIPSRVLRRRHICSVNL